MSDSVVGEVKKQVTDIQAKSNLRRGNNEGKDPGLGHPRDGGQVRAWAVKSARQAKLEVET